MGLAIAATLVIGFVACNIVMGLGMWVAEKAEAAMQQGGEADDE